MEILDYGTFTCVTKAMEITSSDTLVLTTESGSFTCGNTLNAAECAYEQLTTSSPTVTAATVTDASTLTVDGTSFPTSGSTAEVVFKGLGSSSATVASDVQLTGTFTNGVPVTSAASPVVVNFHTTSSNNMLWVGASVLDSAKPKELTVTGTTFPTADYNAVVVFNGIESVSAIIDSANQITATFAKNVAAEDKSIQSFVRFVPTAGGRNLIATSEY